METLKVVLALSGVIVTFAAFFVWLVKKLIKLNITTTEALKDSTHATENNTKAINALSKYIKQPAPVQQIRRRGR